MRRVVPPANLPYKYARVYVVVLTVAGRSRLPARHLVPRLPRPIVLAVLLFVPVPSVQASPPAAEEDLPPTHVIADHVVISEVKPNGAGTNEFVDNHINIFDLAIIGSQYGRDGPTGDINRDGWVNIQDLSLASGNFSKMGGEYSWSP